MLYESKVLFCEERFQRRSSFINRDKTKKLSQSSYTGRSAIELSSCASYETPQKHSVILPMFTAENCGEWRKNLLLP